MFLNTDAESPTRALLPRGISFSTLNRRENSRTIPSRLARMRLLDYCAKNGVSIEIILDWNARSSARVQNMMGEEIKNG